MGLFTKMFGQKPQASPAGTEGGLKAPVSQSAPEPEWRYRQAYGEGGAQVASVAQEKNTVETQASLASPTSTPEAPTDNRPEWIKREEPKLQKGYAKEGIAQISQVPKTPPPAAGENKG